MILILQLTLTIFDKNHQATLGETELKILNCTCKEAPTHSQENTTGICTLVNEGLTQVATVQQPRVTDLQGDGRTQILLF